jgi:hypothetical protein
MSRNKLIKIIKYLIIDNKQIRSNSVVSDKFVMIREAWEKLIELLTNLKEMLPVMNNIYLVNQVVHLPSLFQINQIDLR